MCITWILDATVSSALDVCVGRGCRRQCEQVSRICCKFHPINSNGHKQLDINHIPWWIQQSPWTQHKGLTCLFVIATEMYRFGEKSCYHGNSQQHCYRQKPYVSFCQPTGLLGLKRPTKWYIFTGLIAHAFWVTKQLQSHLILVIQNLSAFEVNHHFEWNSMLDPKHSLQPVKPINDNCPTKVQYLETGTYALTVALVRHWKKNSRSPWRQTIRDLGIYYCCQMLFITGISFSHAHFTEKQTELKNWFIWSSDSFKVCLY